MTPSGSPGGVRGVEADVGDAAQVRDLMAGVHRRFGRLDVVFGNAGIMRDGSVVDLSEEDWDAMFEVNVKGAFLCGKYGVPLLRGSGGGSFIITASANSFYVESDIAGYCATKGAAIQLTRAMAIDHGPDGVRVNCICPGWIETPMSQPFLDENPQAVSSPAGSPPWGVSEHRMTLPRWPSSLPAMTPALSPARRITWTAGGPLA